ncbi:hypothetical protein C3L33_13774, partial [Rhododendron williamsianum]
MPELRSGVHHGRAPAVDKRQRKNQVTGKKSEHLVGNFVKTRAAAVKEEAKAKAKARAAEVAPRRGWGARLVEGAAKNGKGKEEEVIVVSEGTMVEGGEREGGFLPEEKVEGGEGGEATVEEEGSTAPFPKKVQVAGSPMDKIDRKLGYGHARAEFVGCVEYFRTIIIYQVGQKRSRLNVEDDDDGLSKKKVRLGVLATQWVSIYNAKMPMKQSTGVHCGGIGVYFPAKDGKHFDLNATEWIMEQWEKNYYISSIAGANNGSSHVVMSKGTQYSQQFYKVSDSFPFKWINKKWREGFHVTSMATAGTRWAVVMSRNAGCSDLAELLLFNFVFVFSLQRLGYL